MLGCAYAAAVPVVAAADWSAEAFYDEFVVGARPVVRAPPPRSAAANFSPSLPAAAP